MIPIPQAVLAPYYKRGYGRPGFKEVLQWGSVNGLPKYALILEAKLNELIICDCQLCEMLIVRDRYVRSRLDK